MSDGVLNIAAKIILSIEDLQATTQTARVVRSHYPIQETAGWSGTPGVVVLRVVIEGLSAGTEHQRRRSQNQASKELGFHTSNLQRKPLQTDALTALGTAYCF